MTLGKITNPQVPFANKVLISLCIASFYFGNFIASFKFLGHDKRPLEEIETINSFGLKTSIFDIVVM